MGSPTELPYTPYLYAEVPNTDNLKGFQAQVAQDPDFTRYIPHNAADTMCLDCAPYPDVFQFVYSPLKNYLDKTLYWRNTIKHTDIYRTAVGISFSPPSEPHAFTKSGLIPTNLQISGTYGSPTFPDPGIRLKGQPNIICRFPIIRSSCWLFGIEQSITITSHASFPFPGKYYWRVRGLNDTNGGYASAWSVSSTVNITLPMVTLAHRRPARQLHTRPRLRGESVLTSD